MPTSSSYIDRKLVKELRARHSIMLNDSVRMNAYRAALQATVRPGMIVADIGCGLGALSFMALEAGAARVHAIEVEPNTINLARQEASRLGWSRQISFHQGLAQTMSLPEPVDLLVSEIFGSLGLDENLLSAASHTRHWLSPGGIFIPHSVTLTLAPVEEPHCKAGPGVHPQQLPRSSWLAQPVSLPPIIVGKTDNPNFTGNPRFTIVRDGSLSGIGGWFATRLTPKIGFTTSPLSPPTHWQQGLLPLNQPLQVTKGMVMELQISILPAPDGLTNNIEFDFSFA